MEGKCGKCWKSPTFEGKLQVFISYLSEMKIVSMFYNSSYSSTFYNLFLPFFVLEIFKFKYGKVFVRHSTSISKFEWFEQPCTVDCVPFFFLHLFFPYCSQLSQLVLKNLILEFAKTIVKPPLIWLNVFAFL